MISELEFHNGTIADPQGTAGHTSLESAVDLPFRTKSTIKLRPYVKCPVLMDPPGIGNWAARGREPERTSRNMK